jgi:Flp pilus assembly protein TadB
VIAWTGLPSGLVPGIAAGAGTAWAGRRWWSSSEPTDTEEPGHADASLAADLVVAAVGSGIPVTTALDAVAGAIGGPVGAALSASARLDQAGAPPETAYRPLLEHSATARIGRALQQARVSGASPVAVLDGAARAERERRRSTRVSRARGAGSLAAIPVGVLFLPAFVLVAVVPVVVGAIGPVLGP